MKKIKIGIFSLVLLSACANSPMHIQQANKIIDSFTKEIKVRSNLLLFGRGGAFMNDIQEFDLDYFSYRNVSVEESRVELVTNVEILLSNINRDYEVRPYLHDYPFTFSNIHFGLVYTDKCTNSWTKAPYIASTTLIEGNIYYDIYNIQKKKLETVYQEPYAEALRIMQQSGL